MSENEARARELVDLFVTTGTHITEMRSSLAVELAAAEERGRRRGVEEAAKEIEAWSHEREFRPILESVTKRVRALAPRDSGREG